MKLQIAIVFLGFMALTSARPNLKDFESSFSALQHDDEIPEELKQLLRDLNDFIRLYPIDEIKDIIQRHWSDEELQATLKFIQSKEFRDIGRTIAKTPEAQAIAQYLRDAPWPWVHQLVQDIARALDHISGKQNAGGGLSGLIDDIIAVLPRDELNALFYEKLENSPVFAAVVEILSSPELIDLLTAAGQSEVIQRQVEILAQNGIDVHKFAEYGLALFGLP